MTRSSSSGRPGRWRALALALATVLAVACTDSIAADGGASPSDPAPTSTLLDPPHIDAAPRVRALVGDEVAVPLSAKSNRGGVAVDVTGLPEGAHHDDGEVRFRPAEAGTWEVTIGATGPDGARSERTLVLEARHPHRPGTFVALGDSVASGHGLQRRHYLGQDPCWRARGDAYPRLAFDAWRADRRDPGDFALVACSGARAGHLLDVPVGGGPAGVAPEGSGDLPQVEWAVLANPAVVTITVGANDLDFTRPERTLDGTRVDPDQLATRLGRVRDGLGAVVTRLVEATDATVVVTTYHDPTAEVPHGIEGCERECFAAAAAEVVAALNETIAAVVAGQPAERVRLADVAERFAGHGAPNGLGPDGVRSGRAPWPLSYLDDVFAATTGTTHAYCARGHGGPSGGESWVNALDCVHPDARGARAYADAVLEALDA